MKEKPKSGWGQYAKMAFLAGVLISTVFSIPWHVHLGDTFIECSGASYMPPYYTGPSRWKIIN
jgi:hypothetical protein